MEFTFTYVVGHLVLQLQAVKWMYKLEGRSLPEVQADSSYDPAAIQFWPPNGLPISWPPSEYFDDKTIVDFAERFDKPVALTRHKRE